MFAKISLVLSMVVLLAAEPRVAFITGASSGIGYTTAKYLAGKGFKVILTARRKEKLESAVKEIRDAGGEANYLILDVTEDQDHIDAFKAAESIYGGIDCVFINAGYEGSTAISLEDQETAEMQKVIDINIMGMLKTIKFGVPYLKKRGGGSMVTVSSIAGTVHSDIFQAVGDSFLPYAASKAATDMMGRAGKAYLKDKIRFYNIKPAVFDSEMVHRMSPEPDVFAQFNPFFAGLVGDPIFIGEAIWHIFNDSTEWQPGQNIVIDNDGTWNAHEFYKTLEIPGGAPTAVQLKSTIRSLSGGDYHCTTENTCKWYNGEVGPLAQKKEEL